MSEGSCGKVHVTSFMWGQPPSAVRRAKLGWFWGLCCVGPGLRPGRRAQLDPAGAISNACDLRFPPPVRHAHPRRNRSLQTLLLHLPAPARPVPPSRPRARSGVRLLRQNSPRQHRRTNDLPAAQAPIMKVYVGTAAPAVRSSAARRLCEEGFCVEGFCVGPGL
jgi:hypothetical protein